MTVYTRLMTNDNRLPEDILYDAIQLTRPLLRHITAAVEALLLESGITVGQRAVLEVLGRNGAMTAPDLTRRLQLKRQFVARMLTEAKEKELVVSSANPDHARAHFYELTKKGRTAIDGIREKEMALVREFAKRFSAEEITVHHTIQAALNDWFADLSRPEKG